jgi:hypothetical protein
MLDVATIGQSKQRETGSAAHWTRSLCVSDTKTDKTAWSALRIQKSKATSICCPALPAGASLVRLFDGDPKLHGRV